MSETTQPVLWCCIPEEEAHPAHCHEIITARTMLPQITAQSSMTKDYTSFFLGSDSIKTDTPFSHFSVQPLILFFE
jgi:hypothetical protein